MCGSIYAVHEHRLTARVHSIRNSAQFRATGGGRGERDGIGTDRIRMCARSNITTSTSIMDWRSLPADGDARVHVHVYVDIAV